MVNVNRNNVYNNRILSALKQFVQFKMDFEDAVELTKMIYVIERCIDKIKTAFYLQAKIRNGVITQWHPYVSFADPDDKVDFEETFYPYIGDREPIEEFSGTVRVYISQADYDSTTSAQRGYVSDLLTLVVR